jgi:ABC transporter DrrB family efflux protein
MTTYSAPQGASAQRPTSGARFLTATVQSARRTMLQYLRTPQLLVMPVVLAAAFLIIFRYIFGGAIHTGSAIDYTDFLIPGFLVQTTLWTGMNTPAGIAEDSTSGVHDRFRSLPIPRSTVMAGRSLADTALSCWALLVVGLLGFAVGFRPDAGLPAIVLAFALMVAMIYAFTWVFISLGLLAGNAQAAQGIASLVVIPFSFVSGAFVPIKSMPSWIQPFAENQPVNVIINAVRSLLLGGVRNAGIGHSSAYWVALSLAWCAGILIVFSTVSVARFSRQR